MPSSRARRLGAIAVAVVMLVSHATLTSKAAAAERGYWLVDAKGNVYEFGGAPFEGSAVSAAAIAAIVPNPSGSGYWLAAADGGVFAFGDAPFKGSMGGQPLNRPIVGMAATPSGDGYWLVASDGGIFAFGDAPFKGSKGGQPLNHPIVGMAATPSGHGYWLVASDGGIFAFNAPFFGSGGASMIDAPIVGMTTTPGGDGYWMADASGDVYDFGAAEFSGEADDCPLPAGIVGIAASGDGTASTPVSRPNCGLPTSTSTTTTTTSPPGGGSAFQIGLVGDTGYTSSQETKFRRARSHMNTFPLAFVTHDGDFKSGSSSCTDSKFRSIRDLFNGFAAPVIYTPGDNEWEDCGDDDPQDRLDSLRDIFFSTNQSLGQRRIPLTRQNSTYVENARWTVGGVVFVTINEPGSTGASGSHRDANVAWLNAAFDFAESSGAPGLMVVWQDNSFSPSGGRLARTLEERTVRFGRPVVLVHGDTHSFHIDHPWDDVDKFTRVETYGTGDCDHWVLVTVDPKSSSVFGFRSMSAP